MSQRNETSMREYYPGIRTIAAIFFFAYWFFKGSMPFSFWWLVLIYSIDYILSIVLLSVMKTYVIAQKKKINKNESRYY